MPQLFAAGASYTAATLAQNHASDISNNRYHGYQSMLTPEWTSDISAQSLAPMGTMPYDWDSSLNGGTGDVPAGYPNSLATTYPTNFVYNFAPTINPYAPQTVGPQNYGSNAILTSISTGNGPNFGFDGNNVTTMPVPKFPIAYGNYTSATDTTPYAAPVVNGYLGATVVVNGTYIFGGSLNKDEADEMNLYSSNRYDQPYGPSDLEWLYRLQDVDGATLTSRLSKLAPVSFLNPADGLTRRRLFSTDSWEPTGWVYANDNPAPYAGAAYNVTIGNNSFSATTDHTFDYNSRFTPTASPSLEIMNQVDGNVTFSGSLTYPTYSGVMANPITTEYIPNPTLPSINPPVQAGSATSTTQAAGSSFFELYPNSGISNVIGLPTGLHTSSTNLFDSPQIPGFRRPMAWSSTTAPTPWSRSRPHRLPIATADQPQHAAADLARPRRAGPPEVVPRDLSAPQGDPAAGRRSTPPRNWPRSASSSSTSSTSATPIVR